MGFPAETNGSIFLGSEPVTAYAPQGDSVFGVEDLVGNVWQYTDEFQDEHTRAAIVRGSSRFAPVEFGGSRWYFPTARENNKHSKYFLMSNSYERAATVGFRCAADTSERAVVLI